MRQVLVAVAAGTLGGFFGFLLTRLRWNSLVISVSATLVGALVGSLLAAVVWFLWPPDEANILAVSLGVPEALVSSGILAGGALLVHFAMETFLNGGSPVLRHRPVLLGAVAGVIGVMGFASGVALRGMR